MALDFDLSEDQSALAEVFSAFFGRESPLAHVRATAHLGFSPELWEKLRALDAPGMRAPMAAGGGGADLGSTLVVAEELGRALAPVPLVEHLVAARLHPVESLVTGAEIATLALRPAADGIWRLVPAGAVADLVIGVHGERTVAVSSSARGSRDPNHGDQPLADRPAAPTGTGGTTDLGSVDVMAGALDEWRVLTAGALVGLAEEALRIGVTYVLERSQFGRPIGSYQAVQHSLSDLPGLIDGARFLAHKAAAAADDEGASVDAASALASMAFLHAADAATVSTDRVLHFHGGYGFSEEHDIQLFFRRARGWAHVLGDPSAERRRLADTLWPPQR